MLKVICISYFGQESFQASSLTLGFAPSMLNQSHVLAGVQIVSTSLGTVNWGTVAGTS